MTVKQLGENSLSPAGDQVSVCTGKKSFYLYKHLEKIHSNFQKVIQCNKYCNVLLVMNTPGSLEHFMVHTDPVLFHEIFLNLLAIALMQAERGCLEFGYILAGKDQFHFFVKDGESNLPEDPYEPVERNNFGPDMDGLAKTASMVEKLEGKLWVEKLPGRGNTWWFTFNVEPSHSRNYPFKELSDPGSLPDWSDKTILVVEDVSNNYLLLETLLKPTGVILISAENGIKAVNAVRKNQDIDLVLMDLKLPVIDGYKASRKIKSLCPWLPVVAVSAYAVGEEIDRCIKAGCDRFLSKPLNTSELIRTMSELFHNIASNRRL